MTEREIFLEALEMGTPEARAAYLEGACARDAALRRKVEELLDGLRPQPGQEDLRGFDWYHLQQSASNEKLALTQVGGRVRRLAYSPDDRTLAFATSGQVILLRGTASEKAAGGGRN